MVRKSIFGQNSEPRGDYYPIPKTIKSGLQAKFRCDLEMLIDQYYIGQTKMFTELLEAFFSDPETKENPKKPIKSELQPKFLRDLENLELRYQSYPIIEEFLNQLLKAKITKQSELRPFLDIYPPPTNKELPEIRDLRNILRETGWMALDPWYCHRDYYMNINQSTIDTALKLYLKPYNRDWCQGLLGDQIGTDSDSEES